MTPWTVACQAPLSVGFPRQEHWSGLPYPSMWHDLLISPIVSERHVGYFQSFITSRARIPYPRIPSTRGNGSVGWLPGQGRVRRRSSRHREAVSAGQPASGLRRSQAPQPPHPSAVSQERVLASGPTQGTTFREAALESDVGVEITHTESRPGSTEASG